MKTLLVLMLVFSHGDFEETPVQEFHSPVECAKQLQNVLSDRIVWEKRFRVSLEGTRSVYTCQTES